MTDEPMPCIPDDYGEAKRYLVGLKRRGVQLGLDRMRRFTEALGQPEKQIPCVHLAGTNGKGSVAAMLEATLRAAGWRVGLYTSPHLVKLGERIQVNREILTESEIVAYTRELAPVAQRSAGHANDHPSYFEFMTVMAFLHFVRRRCDFAVIETGLGGRLDATNVVIPEVSLITSIGLDHVEILGGTLERIAQEKAGIIKPGIPLVIGRIPHAAETVIRAVAAEQRAPVISARDEFGDNVGTLPSTNLHGEYQRLNAATAALAARALGRRWRLDDGLVRRALHEVSWPGRWQRTDIGGRGVVLDASHNADGASVLDANLAQLVRDTSRRPVVVVGVLGAARAQPLLEVIRRHARDIYLVVPRQSRACSHAELESFVPTTFRGRIVRSTIEALFPDAGHCTAGSGDEPVVVTGSIYLLGEVMARIDPSHGPAESELQDF